MQALLRICLSTLVCCAAITGAMAIEITEDPVAVLQSDASFEEKAAACRTLQRHGGEGAVPVLATLLTDQKLSHMARLALETMPYAEVDEALRDALSKTSGDLQVGIINSLGNRRDADAVPALVDVLAGDDVMTLQAAARALGQIANQDALDALFRAAMREDLDAAALTPVLEALLDIADRAAAKNEPGLAIMVYDRVREDTKATAPIRAAAMRGSALTKGDDDGLAIVLEALRAEDDTLFVAALRTAQEFPQAGATTALAAVLPDLETDRRVRLIQVLGERRDAGAGDALMAQAREGDTAVRVAALAALTRLGHAPVVDLARELLWTEEDVIAQAARDTISFFPGDAGDEAVRAMVKSEDTETRKLAVQLIGTGALPQPVDLLMAVANEDANTEVRVAALNALRTHANQEQVQDLLYHVLQAEAGEVRSAAETALTSLCTRLAQVSPDAIEVREAVYGDLPDGPKENVTGRVATLVASGKLSIAASNELFGDTAPGIRKQLRVTYAIEGAVTTKVADEGGTLSITNATVPDEVTQQFLTAFQDAEGAAKTSMIRLLGATGSTEALDIIRKVAASDDIDTREVAIRELAEWPTLEALDPIMHLALETDDDSIRVLGLRGTVRLLRQSGYPSATLLDKYALLLESTKAADERKLILSALGDLSSPEAFEMAVLCVVDEDVRAEAVQAATAIAERLGTSARANTDFFNGTDLTGWSGPEGYWSVEEGAIVGRSDTEIPKNTFLWADDQVADFYLVLDVKLVPNEANAGIQFRSEKIDDYGQAKGYQADMGAEVWGRLYHEHGRGKLFWDGRAERVVEPGEWNRYEILAVGPAIWTAINGKLGVAFLDDPKLAERAGQIALQVHAGPPQTVHYRIEKLVHNPEVKLEGLDTESLIRALEKGE